MGLLLLGMAVGEVPMAVNYYTDGGTTYLEVDFMGRYRRNVRDKERYHEIDGVNADLCYYIARLRRHSWCFFRKQETLLMVLHIFVNAYNRFYEAKLA